MSERETDLASDSPGLPQPVVQHLLRLSRAWGSQLMFKLEIPEGLMQQVVL